MIKINQKAYRLKNTIQHYEWGTRGNDAIIPKILGIEPEQNRPYAELWIGAHPKSPSQIEIDNTTFPLNLLIEQFPKEILGNRIIEKFGTQLPYLLKVLSSAEALSIQAHPNKKLAKVLHEKDPKNYPDENHKPEIAIVIDTLNAIAGFRPENEIKEVVQKYPVLLKYSEFKSINDFDLKTFYSKIMMLEEAQLKTIIDKIKSAIDSAQSRGKEEVEFLRQFEKYGYDVGLISILLFNYVTLTNGEAIATKAGVPHAYLRGNIIECMANSDNVVRAGLTPKFKDVDTLIQMLDYRSSQIDILKSDSEQNENIYTSDAEEFSVLNVKGEYVKSIDKNNDIIIGFVLNGIVQINYGSEKKYYHKGESFLIPAVLESLKIYGKEDTNYFMVFVP